MNGIAFTSSFLKSSFGSWRRSESSDDGFYVVVAGVVETISAYSAEEDISLEHSSVNIGL